MDDELHYLREKKKKELMEAIESHKKAVIVHVDEKNFLQLIAIHPKFVIDFWAEWCGPCKMVAPIIEKCTSDFAGKVTFGKCNTDQNPRLASRFGISAIPTILFFLDGQLANRVIGAYPETVIKKQIVATYGLQS